LEGLGDRDGGPATHDPQAATARLVNTLDWPLRLRRDMRGEANGSTAADASPAKKRENGSLAAQRDRALDSAKKRSSSALKCQVLRTQRPTGLDSATLTRPVSASSGIDCRGAVAGSTELVAIIDPVATQRHPGLSSAVRTSTSDRIRRWREAVATETAAGQTPDPPFGARSDGCA